MTSTPVGGGCYRRANAQLTTTASHTRAASRPGTPRAARPAASKNGLVLIGLSARFVIVRGPALSPRPPLRSIRSIVQEGSCPRPSPSAMAPSPVSVSTSPPPAPRSPTGIAKSPPKGPPPKAPYPAESRTFAGQSKLPKLPIPPLEETCQRYLRALEPLQDEEEHEATKAAVAEFLSAYMRSDQRSVVADACNRGRRWREAAAEAPRVGQDARLVH